MAFYLVDPVAKEPGDYPMGTELVLKACNGRGSKLLCPGSFIGGQRGPLRIDLKMGWRDIIGWSLYYSLQYLNIVPWFIVHSIPLAAAARTEEHPILIAGGQAMYNPLPVAKFFDAIVIGDGEAVMPEMLRRLDEATTKAEFLDSIADIDGVWLPARGRYPVRAAREYDMSRWLLQDSDTDNDVLHLEIARSCPHGCAFCLLTWAGRPYRMAEPEAVIAGIRTTTRHTVNLFSPSGATCRHYKDYLRAAATAGKRVSSWDNRVTDVDEDLLDLLHEAGSVGAMYGVEGLSERVRLALGKPISSTELLNVLRMSFERMPFLRLMYISRVPGLSWADIREFADVMQEALTMRDRLQPQDDRGRIRWLSKVPVSQREYEGWIDLTRVTFSRTKLMAVPHTPLQWLGYRPPTHIDLAAEEAIHALCQEFEYSDAAWQSSEERYQVEWVLTRGDERVADALIRFGTTYRGFKFRGGLPPERAAKFLSYCETDAASAAMRPRKAGEEMPWSFIDVGCDARARADVFKTFAGIMLEGQPRPGC